MNKHAVLLFPVLFRLYDGDGDGSVGREDVERAMEVMHKMVGPLLAQERGEEEGGGEGTDGERGKEAPDKLSVAATTRVKEICKVLNRVSLTFTQPRAGFYSSALEWRLW